VEKFDVPYYTSFDDMVADCDIDVVSICTRTASMPNMPLSPGGKKACGM